MKNVPLRECFVSQSRDSRVFGKRAPHHILILASGERVRHMAIRPWMTGLAVGAVAIVSLGYLAATSYLVLRDDLIGATMARQARMQYEYEDRIAALRAQVDRVTSRQMLDQQVVEDKVEKLLEQQTALASRHGKMGSLLDRAEASGIKAPDDGTTPAPAADSNHQASNGGLRAIDALIGKASAAATGDSALAYAETGTTNTARESAGDRADRIFSAMTLSLKTIEHDQLAKVETLTAGATDTAERMEGIIQRTGVAIEPPKASQDTSGEGGPFVDPMNTNDFDQSLNRLDNALNRLESVRATAIRLPFANPAPGRDITSTFGNRTDPFLGKLAMHTGVDFRFETGEAVHCTGAGKVTAAGPAGGYGNMVEIDHGNGLSTRYGHLSRILVSVGDTVAAGDTVGRAGSTGRSTGPHLHYEVRYMGEPENPMRFLNAGAKLTAFLQ